MKKGTVYLVHFDSPYHHARHYMGFTDDLDVRIKRHRSGDGSRLLRALKIAGIGWRVAVTWKGDRSLERLLKNRKNSPQLCPVCRGETK
jgi:predicted GIY-YIG superfamily endonuclease